ncbi:hypothetical protein PAGA_a2808 [Pseudoalteromonas agarivorans DSM 14585]|uniref:Uncharacterized protein n=1 Tax=Pseudoalteromonas agarivorans DSM 14585 TaxID=1312369 RepID=A0ACA8DXL4_9GAMM|nr:hypothetical protein PAGA_a2808 [Pseudoalteromonas agarivorans DSM 14585]
MLAEKLKNTYIYKVVTFIASLHIIFIFVCYCHPIIIP